MDHNMDIDQTCYFENFSSMGSNSAGYGHECDSDNVSDLQAYYMAQFNLELEAGAQAKKRSEHLKYGYGDQVATDINHIPTNWLHDSESEMAKLCSTIPDNNAFQLNISKITNKYSLDDINEVFGNDIAVSNVMPINNDSNNYDQKEKHDFEAHCVDDDNSDYIDDEQLIMEELCKVDENVSCRLSPDMFTDEFLSAITKDQNLLPPIEKAFSKHYCNYTNRDASIPQNGSNICNNLDISVHDETTLTINNLDNYSYPNNILNNLATENIYSLPDTPTSSIEFTYDDSMDRRKVSICESIESDLQSIDYYPEGAGHIGDDEIFMNLDELGLQFENDDDTYDDESDSTGQKRCKMDKKTDRVKYHGDRLCLWESCLEKYPTQATLVEHIERAHVNTYKGEEYCCMWSECARSRRPFNARYKLLIHMRVHSGHKPNRCNHPGCGKAFSRLENLKIHVRSHTGERPYACPSPHCRKAFSNSSDRAKHQRTHFNARPYACGAVGCGKRYTDPSSLRKHVKTHPHSQVFTHTHVYTPPPPRVDKMAARIAPKMAERSTNMTPHSPVKLHTIRSIRNKLAPELLLRTNQLL